MSQPQSASENSTEAGVLVTGISSIVDDHQARTPLAVYRGAPLISDVDHRSQLDSLIRRTVETALGSFSRTMTRKLDDLEDRVTLKLDDLTKKMSKLETTVGIKEDDRLNDDWLTLLGQDFENSSFYVSPHLTSGSSGHVFIRESYRDICKALLKIQSDSPSRNVKYLITGTPGIGKSYFAFHLLRHLLAEPGDSVLYQNCHKDIKYYVVLERNADNSYGIQHYHGSEIKNVDYLCGDTHVSWYIFDAWHTRGPLPQRCDAPTIVISSPDYSQYKEHCQDNPVKLYMPPWTWEEIERLITMRQANGETVNEQNAKKAFDFWGGVVREVFSPDVDKRKEVLDDAIARSDVGSVIQFVQACGEVSQCVSHKVLHQKPIVDEHGTVDYRQIRMDFASDYVKKRIMEIHSQLESVDNLIKAAEIMYYKNDKCIREVCGFYFELAVHKGIESNCKYEAMYLGKWKGDDNGRHGYIMPEFSDHRKFESSMEAIENPEWRLPREYEKYYLEPDRCFPAIDSFIPSKKVFFQITIKRDHKVKVEPLWKLIKALGWKPEDVHLIFVTLPEVFDDFKVQIPSPRNADGCKAFGEVRQYVMKFPTIPKSDFTGEERFV